MLCHRIKQCCPSFISIETMELPFVETGDACHQWESADDVHAWLDGILRAIWFFDEEQCVECVPLVLSYLPHDRTVYSYFQYYFDLRLMWKVCVLLFLRGSETQHWSPLRKIRSYLRIRNIILIALVKKKKNQNKK